MPKLKLQCAMGARIKEKIQEWNEKKGKKICVAINGDYVEK